MTLHSSASAVSLLQIHNLLLWISIWSGSATAA